MKDGIPFSEWIRMPMEIACGLSFSERNTLSMAYNRWLFESNEAHKNEYELKDNALQVINFLDSRGLLKTDEVKAFVKPMMKKGSEEE